MTGGSCLSLGTTGLWGPVNRVNLVCKSMERLMVVRYLKDFFKILNFESCLDNLRLNWLGMMGFREMCSDVWKFCDLTWFRGAKRGIRLKMADLANFVDLWSFYSGESKAHRWFTALNDSLVSNISLGTYQCACQVVHIVIACILVAWLPSLRNCLSQQKSSDSRLNHSMTSFRVNLFTFTSTKGWMTVDKNQLLHLSKLSRG